MLDALRLALTDTDARAWRPIVIDISADDRADLTVFCKQHAIQLYDSLDRQRDELRQIDRQSATAGECWIYYPWRRAITRLAAPAEFSRLRTNRNRNKITAAEQRHFASKRVGVVGLSVGHASALSIVQEALCGEIRLADFDVLDLSNLNRLRSSVLNIGLAKTIIAARDIAELDPYIEVRTYDEGITEQNIDDFFERGGRLDVVVDECDSWHIKIKLREAARTLGVAVVMATDDRGMVDVERYDLDRNYPLLHGLLGSLSFEEAKRASGKERLAMLYAFLGGKHEASPRLRASLDLIGSELVSYPQLATDVNLSAALVADCVRKTLLSDRFKSGRYRVDLDALLPSGES